MLAITYATTNSTDAIALSLKTVLHSNDNAIDVSKSYLSKVAIQRWLYNDTEVVDIARVARNINNSIPIRLKTSLIVVKCQQRLRPQRNDGRRLCNESFLS